MSSSDNAFYRANISIKLNGVESQLSPMSFSVTEFDSIYQLYPKAKIIVSDYEGIMNEYLGFVNGTSIEVTFGENEDLAKKCTFVVAKNAVPQQKTSSNGIGGDFEIELIHEYYAKQKKSSKAYESNISSIVNDLVKKYNFDKIDIESTLNNGIWYQPFVTDSEFIINYMLPLAYSSTSRNTPFYAFIDSNNAFHFKSFNSMYNSTPLKKLTYGTQGIDIVANNEVLSSVNFSQLELSKIKPFYSYDYFKYDKDGKFDEKKDKLTKYLNTQGKYPTINDIDEPMSIMSLYDDDIFMEDTTNNNKGIVINIHNEVILPDKIIINTVLNKSLVCGNTINISLPDVKSNASSEESLRNSGKYLIESSYHIWDGSKAKTTLVCSKQNIQISDNYKNKHLLYS
jgi:hypothetical protein